jgi:hypothetical protein
MHADGHRQKEEELLPTTDYTDSTDSAPLLPDFVGAIPVGRPEVHKSLTATVVRNILQEISGRLAVDGNLDNVSWLGIIDRMKLDCGPEDRIIKAVVHKGD